MHCTELSPGIVLMSKRHCTYTLADKVDREGHLEESFHLTWLEVQLLHNKSEQKIQ